MRRHWREDGVRSDQSISILTRPGFCLHTHFKKEAPVSSLGVSQGCTHSDEQQHPKTFQECQVEFFL